MVEDHAGANEADAGDHPLNDARDICLPVMRHCQHVERRA